MIPVVFGESGDRWPTGSRNAASHKRAMVWIAATGSQAASSPPAGIHRDKRVFNPKSRQSPSANQTSPKSRKR